MEAATRASRGTGLGLALAGGSSSCTAAASAWKAHGQRFHLYLHAPCAGTRDDCRRSKSTYAPAREGIQVLVASGLLITRSVIVVGALIACAPAAALDFNLALRTIGLPGRIRISATCVTSRRRDLKADSLVGFQARHDSVRSGAHRPDGGKRSPTRDDGVSEDTLGVRSFRRTMIGVPRGRLRPHFSSTRRTPRWAKLRRLACPGIYSLSRFMMLTRSGHQDLCWTHRDQPDGYWGKADLKFRLPPQRIAQPVYVRKSRAKGLILPTHGSLLCGAGFTAQCRDRSGVTIPGTFTPTTIPFPRPPAGPVCARQCLLQLTLQC